MLEFIENNKPAAIFWTSCEKIIKFCTPLSSPIDRARHEKPNTIETTSLSSVCKNSSHLVMVMTYQIHTAHYIFWNLGWIEFIEQRKFFIVNLIDILSFKLNFLVSAMKCNLTLLPKFTPIDFSTYVFFPQKNITFQIQRKTFAAK